MISLVRGLVRYLATPVFLSLALANVMLDAASGQSMSEMMGMGPPQPLAVAPGLLVSPGVSAVLQSMWLMYLLMGLFHAGAWLDLLRVRRPPKSQPPTAEF